MIKNIFKTIESRYEPSETLKVPVDQIGFYFLGKGISWMGFWIFLGMVLSV